MALRNIVVEGDEILRKKCREVTEIDDRIRIILDDMIDTMRAYNGVGIAAPQVGIMKRMFVIEVEEGDVIELINPEIIETKGSAWEDEGCLSIPGMIGTVERPEYVKIKGLDRFGNEVVYEAEGYKAVAFCHENDHLDGILYIDKAKDIRDAEEE
ncbi:peptide deformylase [Aminipila luticellarii]|uniref:Peptide deformylase n=1 Tax=Aminipila luticellarii TaxID=2507160 RepID=A0A410PWA7_9FIRM|nr:peptide deformylase [Aminipila luticellarii]QAT43194.1 peptide deformylase [Aminipila luticellarii]